MADPLYCLWCHNDRSWVVDTECICEVACDKAWCAVIEDGNYEPPPVPKFT